jgi:pyruvate/2-oxoacid:ferredoxin oxidoreductase beta subunit
MPDDPCSFFHDGVKRFFDCQKRDVTCVAIVGDGTTADIGFQVLSTAAERREKILYICYDNETYMNSGIQRTSTTLLKSWTTAAQGGQKGRGKRNAPKNVPLLMAFHEIPYAAAQTHPGFHHYDGEILRSFGRRN